MAAARARALNVQGITYVEFHCPACKRDHAITFPRWHWNGRLDRPTFHPSVKVEGGGICHFYVTDGKIQFGGDCTHALRSKTVDLPDWEEEEKPIMAAKKDFKPGDQVTINAGHLAGVAAEVILKSPEGANVVRITDTNSFENMLAMLTDDQLDPREVKKADGQKPEIEL